MFLSFEYSPDLPNLVVLAPHQVVEYKTCSQKHPGLCPARDGEHFAKLFHAAYSLQRHLIEVSEIGTTLKVSCGADGADDPAEIYMTVAYIRLANPVLVVSAVYGARDNDDDDGHLTLGAVDEGEGSSVISRLDIAFTASLMDYIRGSKFMQ